MQLCGNCLARTDQVGDEALIDFQIAFVFAKIAHGMALGEHAPHFRPQIEGVWQYLEHDIAVASAKTAKSQCRETQCVRRVICEVKPAFE